MKYFFPSLEESNNKLQSRLLRITAVFLFLICISITFAPAVRLHSWQADYQFLQWIGFGIWFISFSVIHYISQKQIPHVDPFLIPITGLLSGWGLITIYRLDASFGFRQSAWLAISAIILCMALRYPNLLGLLRRYKYVWLICGLLLTALTFIFGTYPGGTGPNLWLNIGDLYLQPSEPLKLLLIIYLAAYFGDQTTLKSQSVRFMAPTIILIVAAVFLLLAQRDLGTALIFILIYFIIGFLASGKSIILMVGGALVTLAGVVGYQIFPVIEQRVNTWLNPWADPMGNSYQIVQSLIAIASGGLIGRGPGLGNPNLVPIAHSDFIFTSIAEEFGLLGTLALMLIFAFLAVRALTIAIRAPNSYRRLLAAGLSVYFSLQAIFIIAGNLNLLPLSGVTLPFVSYGGSSLVVSFAAIAILAIISNQTDTENSINVDTDPYLVLGSLILCAWLVLALTNGYWVLIRSDDLLSRSDNLRSAIGDLYVPRGNFLDRNNAPLTQSSGERGDYSVELLYPSLSPIIGYSDLYYGQAGLEASLDPYLRGMQANATSEIWSNAILYSQRPPGLNVRLSLDIEVQTIAGSMLEGVKGAVVLLNAQSGEILTIASTPYFDTNSLQENWDKWNSDPDSPFLNRALQGQYYPETALAPFFLYQTLVTGDLPAIPDQLSYPVKSQVISCARVPESSTDWGTLISSGCPGAAVTLANMLSGEDLYKLYDRLEFFDAPEMDMPVSDPVQTNADNLITFFNEETEGLYISPLQMALAAASLTSDGQLPDPSLVLGVQTPHQGWIILNPGASTEALDAYTTNQVVDMLTEPSSIIWQSIGYGKGTGEQLTTWYIGGTTPEWLGSPLAIAVVIEEENPDLAEQIGQTVLNATIHPANP
ncbi:MAG: FtsW/RodA/SpoVE family cell cycle protein [Chloroflexi bacterium]|nr:FtsW/RodA/SpoVE family cell cycle protein [Chloroflexota bacterium]